MHIKASQRHLISNQNTPDSLIREENIDSPTSQTLADDTTIRDLNDTFTKNFLHLNEDKIEMEVGKIEPEIHNSYPASE